MNEKVCDSQRYTSIHHRQNNFSHIDMCTHTRTYVIQWAFTIEHFLAMELYFPEWKWTFSRHQYTRDKNTFDDKHPLHTPAIPIFWLDICELLVLLLLPSSSEATLHCKRPMTVVMDGCQKCYGSFTMFTAAALYEWPNGLNTMKQTKIHDGFWVTL